MLLLPIGLLNGPPPGLLDVIKAVVKGAWSVRRVRAAYGGAALRVRRPSDNREQDVGFDGEGNLDIVFLLGFCGTGDGYVSRWYDQSGFGQDLVQTNAVSQPRITASGSIRKLDNALARPCLSFASSNMQFLTNTSFMLGGSAYASASVASRTGNISQYGRLVSFAGGGNAIDYNSSQSVIFCLMNSGQLSGHQNGVWGSAVPIGITPFQACSVWAGSSHTMIVDGAAGSLVSTAGTLAAVGTLSVGDNVNSNNDLDLWDGNMAEHVICSGALNASDQSILRSNQKSYFGTY